MSNTEQNPEYISLPAGSDLTGKKNRFVKLSSGKLATATAGAAAIGILHDEPAAADEPGLVCIGGIHRVIGGGTCTKDLPAASDADGKAVNASGSDRTLGVFLDTGGAGDLVRVLVSAVGATAQAADYEAISSSGALNPDIPTTLLTVSGTKAYTLAAGTTVGQKKYIECVSAASTPLGTVTLADADGSEPLTHVFTAVGQRLELEWRTGGWKVTRKVRAGTQVVVIGTTVLTGYDMAAVYDLQTTGTVHSTTTKSIPNGLVTGEMIGLICTVAATCPVGDIDFVGQSLVGAAVTHITAITATTDNATLLWNGSAWVPLLNTGLTIN